MPRSRSCAATRSARRCRSTTWSRWRWRGTWARGTGPDELRLRFANDPANLLAVAGQANQDKGDKEPSGWMPPNTAFWRQYAVQFVAVLRGYGLPIDHSSATVLRQAAATFPGQLKP